MLGPAIILLALFTLYPFVVNVKNSLLYYNLTEPNNIRFVGLKNYLNLMKDSLFWQALKQTLYFVVGSVAIEFFLGLGIAHLLLRDFTGKNLLRTIFILPMGATPIAISFVWKIMLTPDLGIINYLVRLLGFRGMDWVGNPTMVIPSLMIIDAWCWTPFMMLIFSAGLMSLPRDPFEAADIDGSNALQKLWYVTLPMLKPLIFVALLFRMIDAFRTFDLIFVITGGGPAHYSETLNIFTYLQGFNFMRISYASTLAIVMFVILFIISSNLSRVYRQTEF